MTAPAASGASFLSECIALQQLPLALLFRGFGALDCFAASVPRARHKKVLLVLLLLLLVLLVLLLRAVQAAPH